MLIQAFILQDPKDSPRGTTGISPANHVRRDIWYELTLAKHVRC
jgi:hypothetical protein